MQLLRVGTPGRERPVVRRSADDTTRDASSICTDYDTAFFAGDGISRLRAALAAGELPEVDISGERIGPPIGRPGKIVCIGLNYRKHAEESGMAIPAEPIIFMKAPNTVVGPHDDIRIPPGSVKTDWEVELAVVIGGRASYLPGPADALDLVAGYAVANDVSEREYQLERDAQWDKGKSCDTFNPLGPWITTADDLPDPQALGMWLDVNGERLQQSTTADMIFGVAEIIWWVSRYMVLEPGDVINTGTPAGVGLGLSPQRYLRPGDVVTLGIDGLGEQRSVCIETPGVGR
jgi:2-keto-4-pentenoate hydratase/2-oxohepta-3-ene-1,7-dioic acid hydratase in catechol pathway